jgi:hypothetical protein
MRNNDEVKCEVRFSTFNHTTMGCTSSKPSAVDHSSLAKKDHRQTSSSAAGANGKTLVISQPKEGSPPDAVAVRSKHQSKSRRNTMHDDDCSEDEGELMILHVIYLNIWFANHVLNDSLYWRSQQMWHHHLRLLLLWYFGQILHAKTTQTNVVLKGTKAKKRKAATIMGRMPHSTMNLKTTATAPSAPPMMIIIIQMKDTLLPIRQLPHPRRHRTRVPKRSFMTMVVLMTRKIASVTC